ncbi:hypothetical protein YT1_5320 [Rhodococcus ruber]|nr:hypothetical protein YT1_5320 [Rhodococcus ruber]
MSWATQPRVKSDRTHPWRPHAGPGLGIPGVGESEIERPPARDATSGRKSSVGGREPHVGTSGHG